MAKDGRTLALVDHDLQTIELRSAETLRPIKAIARAHHRITALALAPRGNALATSSDGTVRLWDVATGEELLTLGTSIGFVWSLHFSPSGSAIASYCTPIDAELSEVRLSQTAKFEPSLQ
jgi:WD40 repeat protein